MGLTRTEQNALARAVQDGVPLSPWPWDEIGQELGLNAGEVLDQLRAWKEERKLREISAVLEGSLLGYEGALCTASVPEEDLPRVAAVVNEHPTVSHNYLRDHVYNLWFTIAVPRAMGLCRTLDCLTARAGLSQIHALRRTRTFKIGVSFDLIARSSQTETMSPRTAASLHPTPAEVALIRALQTALPLTERPFLELARVTGTDEDQILAFGQKHLGAAIRRYVATFRQRELGVHGNVLVAWNVPEGRVEETGLSFAAVPEVSHCYGRESFPGFPYTLYTMLHGPDEASCQRQAADLSSRIGIRDYLLLPSRHEFKKCRLRYFLPELDRWWATCEGEAAA